MFGARPLAILLTAALTTALTTTCVPRVQMPGTTAIPCARTRFP